MIKIPSYMLLYKYWPVSGALLASYVHPSCFVMYTTDVFKQQLVCVIPTIGLRNFVYNLISGIPMFCSADS